MPREDGFAVADLDVSYFGDTKLKRLWRELHDPARMGLAVTLHLAAIFESWSTGDRVSIEEAAPMWLDVDPDLRAALEVCGLVGKDGKVPAKTWESWFGPAVKRRQSARARGAKGGRSKPGISPPKAEAKPDSSSATDGLNPSVRPSSPSVPSNNPSSPSREETTGLKTNDEARNGLAPVRDLFPPIGSRRVS